MPTFLHTADIHLDSAFSARFDARRAAQRRHELLRAVSQMADIAKNLDIWLIAGDLFDGANISGETIAFLKRIFSEIPNTRIFISAGNHDAFSPNSIYAKEDFGDNVYVFPTTGACVELDDIRVRVFGASFASQSCERLAVPRIEKKDGYYDIMLLHADLVSRGGESAYNPIDKAFIENCGADYLALGHIHKRSEPQHIGNTMYAYSGPPEGRGFDECGDMGCYIGTIGDDGIAVEFKSICRRRMIIAEVDLSNFKDNLEVVSAAEKKMLSMGGCEDIYRLVLKGRALRDTFNIDIIKEELLPRVHYLEIKDETVSAYDFDELAMRKDLCGDFVRAMNEKIKNADADEKSVLNYALMIGTEALLGGDAQ